jgi:RNA polymerase sigma factor (sigma-70 family)
MNDPQMLFRQNYAWLAKSISFAVHRLMTLGGFNSQDAADFRQELWVRVLEKLPGYDEGRSSFTTYLENVLRWKAIHLLQKHRRRLRTVSLDEEAPNEDGELVPRSELISEEDYARAWGRHYRSPAEQVELAADLETALRALPADLRILCQELASEDRTNVTRMARRQGCSSATLFQLRRRARERLRDFGFEDCLRRS